MYLGIQKYLLKVAYYSLWGSSDAFNNMITAGAHCEGANNKCKVQTIIQDNGCMLFYHALARVSIRRLMLKLFYSKAINLKILLWILK